MLGTLPSVRLRLIMSFKYAWLAYLSGPSPQENSCDPFTAINPRQGHM